MIIKKKRTFSSTKFKQPSRGTKQAIVFPFLINCTLTPLRIAELGCFASRPLVNELLILFQNEKEKIYIFSNTMPLAIQDPPNGFAFI